MIAQATGSARHCPVCDAKYGPKKRSDAKTCGDWACQKELQRHPRNPHKPQRGDPYLKDSVESPRRRVKVPPDPLRGVHPDILACVYGNGHSSPLRYREPVDFRVINPPECASRSCRQPRSGRSAFCASHTQLEDAKTHVRVGPDLDAAAENNVVSIWSLRLPRDLPDYTVAGLLGLPMPIEIAA